MTTTTDLLRRAAVLLAVLLDVYAADGGAPADKKYDDTHEIISGLLALAGQMERAQPVANSPSIGDYVLATKYSDGDFGDPWYVGFLLAMCGDRFVVGMSDDDPGNCRAYRRCEKITGAVGGLLLKISPPLEGLVNPDEFNVWALRDALAAMEDPKP